MNDISTSIKATVLDQIANEIRAEINTAYCEKVVTLSIELFHRLSASEMEKIGVKALAKTAISFSGKIHQDIHKVQNTDSDINVKPPETITKWECQLQLILQDLHNTTPTKCDPRYYLGALPSAYQEHFSIEYAINDIKNIEALTTKTPISLHFYKPLTLLDNELRFKIYSVKEHVVLSDVIPILENLGMRVLGEHPYQVNRQDGRVFWISDFKVSHPHVSEETLDNTKPLIHQAFKQIWFGYAENDAFNQLIIGTGLGWREVAVLRAYARYIKQLRFGFSQPFIAETLSNYKTITKSLISLFDVRFNPELDQDREDRAAKIELFIINTLDDVESLDHDRILRRFLFLIKATLRTNYFQRTPTGELKEYFSFKLDPHQIPDTPLPRPKYEVFIYSPQVEGVHLRSGAVARGGLRWSDRQEDYRTEVLGLVKAQQVKNSVIVPMGAKGCFIAKRLPSHGSREDIQAEGIACYKIYIRGLLDLTDNLSDNTVIPPREVVRHDGDDTYLVVAADKGTATFSDIANDISNEYNFWLGDAFASGGSQGYDHKKMGITARGAWESVKCHFREKNIDSQQDHFSVIGIGDMGGDVFGNGMLLSTSIQLLAAFNHQHIFIDPRPDNQTSYRERERMFALPRSSWADYNTKLISRGGGIFSRASKWIRISAEMKEVFDISQERLTPNDLITALLKAPVDMLWNGGIGTYIKSSTETHADVGDKANDSLRINGSQLRCKVVGEGGNLGLTQRGRIEFSLSGGAINTDFIDNAGGVDCSDHEVNIKILLNEQVNKGQLDVENRNILLREMTDDVSSLVLKNNYRQALSLRLAESKSSSSVDDYIRLINRLEKEGKLNRSLEFLPEDKTLIARKEQGRGLSRPELSVLISYVKIELKQALAYSWITDDEDFSKAINTAFPTVLRKKFPEAIEQHRLRSEIIATQIANDLINRMGITFIDKMRSATGASHSQLAAAYLCIIEVYNIEERWREVESLDGKIDPVVQSKMFHDLIALIRRASHWFLRHHRYDLNLNNAKKTYKPALQSATESIKLLSKNIPIDRWQNNYYEYCEQGAPDQIGAYCASAGSQYWLLDIIDIAIDKQQRVSDVANIYFHLGKALNLVWLDQKIRQLQPKNHWESLSILRFRNELDFQLRGLTGSVFTLACANTGSQESSEAQLLEWKKRKHSLLNRWHKTLSDIQESKICDYAVFSVALSDLKELS